MLWSINELISLELLIWLLPIAFFIHDGEEIATVERWLRQNQDHPRIAAKNRMLNWEKNITFQFTVAVLLLGLLLFLISYFTSGTFRSTGKLNLLFIGAVTVLLIDGIKHLGFTILLKQYTSGVITAVLVEIPYGAYALSRFYAAGLTDIGANLLALALGLPLTIFFVWLGLTLGRIVAPFRSM
ncbi:HXXEE domain-containing protein [Rubeoparvulum massiliense]|uniref:HXXEE domain-containing protein n=1 Tax=Rubeoparvulum massiliense TaxID=1631346 RepID=UPI00065DF829|nr:HXXEE domain-containing protein [Rubeoparvulum massiliense]